MKTTGMPSKKCVNCGQEKYERVEGVFALTKVEKGEEGLTFFPASGIPVLVYVCTNCGKLELFSAKHEL